MSLNYPPYASNEYGFLNQNLSVVDYYLQLRAVDEELHTLRPALEEARKVANTQGKGLMKSICDEVKAYEDATRPDGSQAVERFRSVVCGPKNVTTHSKREQAVVRLYHAYSKFDQKAFEEEFKHVYADEISQSAEYRREVQSLTAKVRMQETKRASLLKEASTAIYKSGECPKKVLDFRLSESFNEIEMTEAVINRFVSVWSDRCTKFDVPVTITGIAIYTLSTARKEVWKSAFERLGFLRLKRRPVFQYLVASTEEEVFNTPTVLRGGE